MSHYSIRVSWSEEDGMFVAVCPALGNLSALGATAPKAVTELEQAIDLAMQTYKAEGWPVPAPDAIEEFSGQFRLRLPRSLHAWLAHEAERQGVSLNSLATSLLAQASGSMETGNSLATEVQAAVASLRATLVSTMRSAIIEMGADASTSWNQGVKPSLYEFQGSGSSASNLKLVGSAR